MLKNNKRYVARVIELDYKADGVVLIDNTYIFIKGALKDELINFELVKLTKKYGIGKLIKVLEMSPQRIGHLNELGSLSLSHLNFESQLSWQEEITKTTFEKALKTDVNVLKTITDNNQFNYRNKVTFHVLNNQEIKLGLYKRDSKTLTEVNHFSLAHPLSNKLLKMINDSKIVVDSSVLKHIMIKNNDNNQLLVTLVGTKSKFQGLVELISLIKGCEYVSGLTLNINTDANKILGNKSFLLAGVNQLRYRDLLITDLSFMQVNYGVMDLTFKLIKENITGNKVLDLYSGIGSIIYSVLDDNKKGIMVESNEENIKLAKLIKNTKKITNLEIIHNLSENYFLNQSFDTLIVDPPRSGLEESLVSNIKEGKIKRFIYLSCNLQTLIRDIRLLENSYKIDKVYPIKMFPETNSLETLVILSNVNYQ